MLSWINDHGKHLYFRINTHWGPNEDRLLLSHVQKGIIQLIKKYYTN